MIASNPDNCCHATRGNANDLKFWFLSLCSHIVWNEQRRSWRRSKILATQVSLARRSTSSTTINHHLFMHFTMLVLSITKPFWNSLVVHPKLLEWRPTIDWITSWRPCYKRERASLLCRLEKCTSLNPSGISSCSSSSPSQRRSRPFLFVVEQSSFTDLNMSFFFTFTWSSPSFQVLNKDLNLLPTEVQEKWGYRKS